MCKKKPVKEEVSKDYELCHPKPKKVRKMIMIMDESVIGMLQVCEEKEIKVPTVICKDREADGEEKAVESI